MASDGPIELAASLIRTWGGIAVIGAGVSVSAGMPLTRDLQSLLWHSLDQDPEARKTLASALNLKDQPAKALIGTDQKVSKIGLEVIRTHGLARRAYQEGFSRLNASRVMTPSPCHDCLAELFHRGFIEMIVSLNWDTLFETSYQRIYGVWPR